MLFVFIDFKSVKCNLRGRHTYAKVPQRRLALSCELEFVNIRFNSFVCVSVHCRALVMFALMCLPASAFVKMSLACRKNSNRCGGNKFLHLCISLHSSIASLRIAFVIVRNCA